MSLKSMLATAVVAGFAIAAPMTAARATILTENFNETPFSLWQAGWFGTNSNAQNYYVDYSGNVPDDRGNNPDGLWIADGSGSATPVTINFTPSFAASLNSFSIDVAGYVPSTLTIFDKSGATLLSTSITDTDGAFTLPGVYASYSVVSASGIGGFSFTGEAQGNISIDNVSVSAVPLPASLPMFGAALLGLLGSGVTSRRKITA